MKALFAGIAYFVFVFFKAFQQRNVAFDHYKWIVPISYCMAATEVIVVSLIAIDATQASSIIDMIPIAFSIGTGGGLGALLAMWVHNRIFRNKT